MDSARNEEVHESGADYTREKQGIAVFDTYQDLSSRTSRMEVFGPPAIFMSGPPATVYKLTRLFYVNGGRREVVEACTRCLTLLEELVEDFSGRGREASMGLQSGRIAD